MRLTERDRWSSIMTPQMVSVVVWLVYFFACMSPVVKQTPDGISRSGITGTVYGWEAMMLGWAPPAFLPWMANLLLLVGWICLLRRRYQTAFVFGIGAVLTSFTVWVVPLQELQSAPCAELLPGCYFWQASFILFAMGSFAIGRLRRSQNEAHAVP